MLARQQEIHDLVRRNTHQAQQRQKLKYDRAISAKVYAKGDLVWVLCRYVPQKGSPKLMRAWRGPHRVVHTLQAGRVYILDTGQKVHFERLKPHNSGPLELVATPLDTGDVAVVMDPEPQHSIEPINDDCYKLSYKAEQILSGLRMLRYLLVSVTGWIRDCAQSCAREEPASITSNSTTPHTDEETHDEMLPIPTYSPQQFTPNPNPKQSPTHRHLTYYQMYQCSPASRNFFPIMSQCAHLHHTFHSQVKLRSYPQWVHLLRC